MTWVAIAVGAATAIAGGVQANANRQRQKGIIGTGYDLAKKRLNITQNDTRQSVAEQSGARGLDQGGDVLTGGNAEPGLTTGVGGAHTLGAQQTADLAREQNLEQYSLVNDKTTALSDVNAAGDQGEIGAALAGAQTAIGIKGTQQEAAAARTPSVASASAAPAPASGWQPTRYPGAFGGIDPINPVKAPVANSDFNVFSRVNQ